MKKALLILSALFLTGYSNAQSEPKSVRQLQYEEYSKYGFTKQEQWDSLYQVQHVGEPMPQKNTSNRSQACVLKKRVFGWHPFWLASNEYLNYDYSLLTDLSFFGYDVDPYSGYATSTHGWMTAPVVTNALNAGVRVNLCVVMFANHAALLNNSTSKQNLINSLISNVKQRGAHGVNIDFEGMDPSTSANFHAFMINLAKQMHAAIPGSEVSIALAGGNWSGTYDVSMVPYVDLFLIMGYDYHWASAPTSGPVAPKCGGGFWTSGDITTSINFYLNAGIPNAKLALGVPYYGYDWPTTSTALNAGTTGAGFSRKYPNAVAAAATYGRKWDNYSSTPYFTYNSGGPRQCWYDDEVSLGLKYDEVKMYNIAGIGIWALGYDAGSTVLWNLLKEKFTDCAAPVGCSGALVDMGGPGNYYNNETWSTTIAPSSGAVVELTFSSFSTEANYDFLYIYDGASTSSPLIGKYSGTTNPGTVKANSGKMTLKFTSDYATTAAGFSATWKCGTGGTTTPPAGDITPPTTSITAPSGYVTQNFTTSFTDKDNTGGSGIKKSFYYVIDNNGTEWRGNKSNGFFRDNFNGAIHSDWSIAAGTWATGSGVIKQSDATIGNSIISSALTQNLSSAYMYNWTGKIEGTGTTKRAGFHFMCDNATSANRGNSYLVWFRVDQSVLEVYKSVNDVLGNPVKSVPVTIAVGTWNDYKVVYDRTTGVISVYLNNVLVTSWTDAAPLQNGSYISFRNGGSVFSVDDIHVYRSRTSTATVSVGAASTNDIRYQNISPTANSGIVKSIVMDVAGNISALANQTINVDFTAAAKVSVVRDGTTTTDISTTTSTTQLSANWTATTDANSGITKYQYAIGKAAGATDVVSWTDNGTSLAVTRAGLSLIAGQIYYVSVRSVNGAGLVSAATISNGQKVASSLASPSVSAVDNGTLETGTEIKLSAYPNPFKDNITINYELLQDQQVVITLVDLLGKESILYSNVGQSAGSYDLKVNTSELGLSNGIYIVRLRAGGEQQFLKLIRNN